MICCTRPLAIHLLRGLTGFLMIAAALWLSHSLPVIALLLGAGSLIAFRGCPTCWIMGLFGMIARQKE